MINKDGLNSRLTALYLLSLADKLHIVLNELHDEISRLNEHVPEEQQSELIKEKVYTGPQVTPSSLFGGSVSLGEIFAAQQSDENWEDRSTGRYEVMRKFASMQFEIRLHAAYIAGINPEKLFRWEGVVDENDEEDQF